MILLSQSLLLLYPHIVSSYGHGFGGTMKPCFLLILLVLALINSGKRLLTAPIASQGGHAKSLLQVLQISPTGMSRGSPNTTVSHSPQC